MLDLLTCLNVGLLGVKPFHLNVFKTGMMALFIAFGLSLLVSKNAENRLVALLTRLNAFSHRQQRLLGWSIGIVFTLFLIYLRVRQYFELQTMFDMTVEANVAWHMVHGPWFFNSMDNDSFLGGHVSLLFFLLGAIYRWAEHPITLLVIHSLALGAGAVAVYMLGLKRSVGTTLALLAMLLYLFNPYVHQISAHDFHMSPLAIPAVLWMLFFIDSNQPWKAAGAAGLAFSAEESIVLPLASLGLYLLVFRRRWRMFGGFLALVSMAYFVLATKLIMPLFTPGQGLFFWNRYANLGANLNEAVHNIVVHPLWAVQEALIHRHQYVYLLYFLIPVAFLPLFSMREMLLLIAPLAIMLLSQDPGMYKLGFHYSALALPYLFYGVVWGLAKLAGHPAWERMWRTQRKSLLAGICFLLALNTYRSPGYDLGKTDPNFASSAFELASLIPPDASVATDLRFGPLLANRHRICRASPFPGEVCSWELQSLSDENWTKPLWEPQYVLIGLEPDKLTAQAVLVHDRYVNWLVGMKGYEQVKNQDGIRLFRAKADVRTSDAYLKDKD